MEDISDLVTSGSRDWSKFYSNRGAYFVRSAEINDYTLRIAEAIRVALPARVEGKRSLIEKDDILVTITGANVGKCARVDTVIPEAYVSQSVALIKLKQKNLAPFVYYAMRAPNFAGRQLTDMAYGVGRPVLSLPQIKSLRIPLAPLIEQHRILEQIEDLLSRVGATNQRLTKVPKILKAFRQSVLAAACSGRLTEDWRAHSSSTESASKLLLRILSQRRHIVSRGEAKEYGEPCEPDTSLLADPAEEWVITSVDALTTLITSGSRGWAKYYSESGATFIRAENINSDALNLADVAYVQPPNNAEGRRTRVKQNDLLITITGANVTKSALVDVDVSDAYVSQHVALVRPVDGATARYLYLWIISPAHGRRKLTNDAYGAGKPGLNLDNIKEMPVALPPLEEQHEIVRRVEALFKLADKIEKRVEAATKRADKLTQSILAKAFRGELVPTEADLARKEGRTYEPASELLARIKSERENPAVPAKLPKRRPTLAGKG